MKELFRLSPLYIHLKFSFSEYTWSNMKLWSFYIRYKMKYSVIEKSSIKTEANFQSAIKKNLSIFYINWEILNFHAVIYKYNIGKGQNLMIQKITNDRSICFPQFSSSPTLLYCVYNSITIIYYIYLLLKSKHNFLYKRKAIHQHIVYNTTTSWKNISG